MKKRVSFVKDKPDFIKTFTKDSILNITGLHGFELNGEDIPQNKNTLFINVNDLYMGKSDNTDTMKLYKLLVKKYIELSYEDFPIYYDEIIEYFKKDKKRSQLILVGPIIYQYLLPRDIKGKLIIKGNSIAHTFPKTLFQEIKEKKNQFKQKEIKRKQYIEEACYLIRRKGKQLKTYKALEEFYHKVEDIK